MFGMSQSSLFGSIDGSGDLPSFLIESELTRGKTAPVSGVSPINGHISVGKLEMTHYNHANPELDSPEPKIQFFNPDRKKLGLSSPLKPFRSDQSQDYLDEKEVKEPKPAAKAKSEFSAPTYRPMDDKAVRFRYLCKLTYKGVWNEQPKKSNNLVIFDWDDTLFPTSAFMPRCQDDLYRIRKKHKEIFEKLDDTVVDLMSSAIAEHNHVAIVTNARLTWVYYSSLLLLPKTAELLRGKV